MPTTTDPFTLTSPYPNSNPASEAAKANLGAGADLESLSALINQINKTANLSRVTGGPELEALSSQNIANELAGNLPQSFVNNIQSDMAQRGAAGGFGVDSANTNAAALRALGLNTLDLQKQGQADLTAAYNRAAPLYTPSLVTPEMVQQGSQFAQNLSERQRELMSQENLGYARLAQEADNSSTQAQLGYARLGAETAQNQAELQQRKEQLAAQMGLAYTQLDAQQQRQIDQLALQQQIAEENSALQWYNMQNQFAYPYMEDYNYGDLTGGTGGGTSAENEPSWSDFGGYFDPSLYLYTNPQSGLQYAPTYDPGLGDFYW